MPSPADALLAAVRADPDADLPRLVYADALDDAGDPERAEFIRVQCELAKLDEWDARRPALEDREHELLDRHEAAWLNGLGDRLTEWEWRRGFVDEATGDFASLAEAAERGWADSPTPAVALVSLADSYERHPELLDDAYWGWLAGVRRLSVAENGLPAEELAPVFRLPGLAGLHALDVSANPILADLPDLLAAAPFRASLQELAAGGFQMDPDRSVLDAAGLAAVLAPAPLDKLYLPNTQLDEAGVGRLLNAPFAPRLTELDLSDNAIRSSFADGFSRLADDAALSRLDISATPDARYRVHHLLRLPALKRLTHLEANRSGGLFWHSPALINDFWDRAEVLRLHSCELPSDAGRTFASLPGLGRLRLLDLADNGLDGSGVSALADAPWLGSLTWLALSRNGVINAAVANLVSYGRLDNLRTLHLAFNPLGTVTAAALAGARGLAQLRILTLSHTAVTDAAVPILLDAPYWRLSGLGLGGCNLTTRAAAALVESFRLRRLQWLDLSNNPGLGGDALLPLAESPHLSRLCELDIAGCGASDRVRSALRERLGRRLSD